MKRKLRNIIIWFLQVKPHAIKNLSQLFQRLHTLCLPFKPLIQSDFHYWKGYLWIRAQVELQGRLLHFARSHFQMASNSESLLDDGQGSKGGSQFRIHLQNVSLHWPPILKQKFLAILWLICLRNGDPEDDPIWISC